MFRVIYEWSVPEHNFDHFKQVWESTTDNIHHTVDGALGSFMLRSSNNPQQILTIAKWRDEAAWQAFFHDANPNAMLQMRQLAERISVNAFYEVEDRTKPIAKL